MTITKKPFKSRDEAYGFEVVHKWRHEQGK